MKKMLLMAKDVSEGAQIEGSRGKHVYFLFLVGGEGSDLMYQLIYSLGNRLYLTHRVRNKASQKKNFSWAVSSVTYESCTKLRTLGA